MVKPNDATKKPNLRDRYAEIGISAVAAALQCKSYLNTEPVKSRWVRIGQTDAIQKSDGMGDSRKMRSPRA